MLDSGCQEIDAMRLMLFRHAKAEKSAPGMGDRDRPLSSRGQKDAARMGAYMAHHGLLPDHAWVSPARRTRETWQGAAAAFPGAIPATFVDRLYNSETATIMAVLREGEPSLHTLLVVGHNPGMHETARQLIASGDVGDRERLHVGLPTSGLVVIDFAVSDWGQLHLHRGRLERFITPRRLGAATD
jgi:phosphohistidine phosphatase